MASFWLLHATVHFIIIPSPIPHSGPLCRLGYQMAVLRQLRCTSSFTPILKGKHKSTHPPDASIHLQVLSARMAMKPGVEGRLDAAAVHFLKHNDQRRLEPVRIIKSLAFQLAKR